MPVFPAAFSAWQYRAPLTYVAAYVGSGGVTNFPYLLPWTTAPAGLWANANADGSDLRLTTTDEETEVNFELTSFTPGSSLMECWPLGASIGSASNTALGYIYWGNAAATAPPAAWGQGVWTAAGYAAVFHGNDTTTSTLTDSVSGLTGTKIGANAPLEVAGPVGRAQSFGNNSDKITIPGSGALNISNNMTLEIWLNQAAGHSWVMTKSGQISFFLENVIYFQCTTGGYCTAPYGTGLWAGVVTTGSRSLYKNGVLVGGPVAGTLTGNNNNLVWGAGAYTGNGIQDELRIANVAKSVAYLLTSYNNQLAPANTVTWGAVEENSSAVYPRRQFSFARFGPSLVRWCL